jgi:hypothetical protein
VTAAGGTAVNALTGPVPMTLDEAATWLHPPMTRVQLGRIVAQLPRLGPVGTRPSGGRPVDVYDAAQLIELHAAIRRWL